MIYNDNYPVVIDCLQPQVLSSSIEDPVGEAAFEVIYPRLAAHPAVVVCFSGRICNILMHYHVYGRHT